MALEQAKKVVFEKKSGDRVFSFIIPSDAALGECHDVALEFLSQVSATSEQIRKKAEEDNEKIKEEDKKQQDAK